MRSKRVPFIMQMEDVDCGAAALAMIMAYYKKELPINEIRTACHVTKDGTNLKNILNAAREYGMEVKGYRYTFKEVSSLKLPAIIHWMNNHFVVLEVIKSDRIAICDPAIGRRLISYQEFEEAFSGFCIELYPGKKFITEKKRDHLFDWLKDFIKPVKREFIILIILGTFTAGFGILEAMLSGAFLDYVLPNTSDYIKSFTALFCILFGSYLVMLLFWQLLQYSIAKKLSQTHQIKLNWKLLHLPIDFFNKHRVGDLLDRQRLPERLTNQMMQGAVPILMNILSAGMAFYVMIRYSIPMTLIVLIILVAETFIIWNDLEKREDMLNRAERFRGRVTGMTLEGIMMYEDIQFCNGRERYLKIYEHELDQWKEADYHAEKVERRHEIQLWILEQSMSVIVILIGVGLILEGRMTSGMLLTYQGLLSGFLLPVQVLFGSRSGYMDINVAVDKLNDIILNGNSTKDNYLKNDISQVKKNHIEKVTKSNNKTPLTIKKSAENICESIDTIQINNLSFGYERGDKGILDSVSLQLKKGEIIGLVGENGCGKSTFAKLLAGLYEPWSGKIEYYNSLGEDITHQYGADKVNMLGSDIGMDISPDIRQNIEHPIILLTGDERFFPESVIDNICMMEEGIDTALVYKAAYDAQIHEEIQVGNGYNTHMSENGQEFSGGQRQRINLAAALLKKPKLLILDEALSALDSETKQKIIASLRTYKIMLIIITQDMEEASLCDILYTIKDGKCSKGGAVHV